MKRFTETRKWGDPWFRALPPHIKTFWQFLCDNCDNAGLWDCDMVLAEFLIGIKYDKAEVLLHFQKNVTVLDGGKWFLPKFILFQWGPLNPENKCHKGILRILNDSHLETEHFIEGPSKDLGRGLQASQEWNGIGMEWNRVLEMPLLLNKAEFVSAFGDWIKFRVRLKTSKDFKGLFNRQLEMLSAYPIPEAIEILKTSMRNDWQGLFPLARKNGNATNRTNHKPTYNPNRGTQMERPAGTPNPYAGISD